MYKKPRDPAIRRDDRRPKSALAGVSSARRTVRKPTLGADPIYVLEAERSRIYTHLLKSGGGRAPQAHVEWLEGELSKVYRLAIEKSRGVTEVDEMYGIWEKMTRVCEFFLDHLRSIAPTSGAKANLERVLDIWEKSREKREFFQC